ncbi:MAG: response regulator transcription factor [Solirubrobacterales bacterium]
MKEFLVVDDHPVLRQGVASVLREGFSGATITEAASVEEAITVSKKRAPDAVIIDPHLGAADATSSLSQLRSALPVPIIVFAAEGNMRMLAEALKAGARACVRKDSPPEILTEAIEAAVGGRFFIDPALATGSDSDLGDENRVLTERQRQILQMFADGAHTDKVAESLGLSTETVRTHTKRILAKLNARTRTHAVAIAIRIQVID